MVQMSSSKRPSTKRAKVFSVTTMPMLVLMLGGSAILMGDRAMLSGIAPPLEDGTPVVKIKKPLRDIQEAYDSRLDRWWKNTKDMPICKHVGAVCNKSGLLPRLRASVASGAKMRNTVMGIGGGPLSLIGLVCAAIGIYLSARLGKKPASSTEKDATASNNINTTVTTAGDDKGRYDRIKSKASDIEENSTKNLDIKEEAKSSLFVSEEDSVDSSQQQQDVLEPSRVIVVMKRMMDNTMTYLSGTNFTWESPVTTYKMFIALLLFVELNDLMAPEQTVMYTPELIKLQRAKPDPREYVPYMADYLTPSLAADTAELWFNRLRVVRGVLLASWFAYLVAPPNRIGGTCYVVGALLYCYLATIGLMYNLGHSMQGGILFILLSIFAVPFLGCPKYGDRAARWLRRVLYAVVLIPIYLFSGVSKFRYKGFWPQITGSWLTSAFTKGGMKRSVFPGLYWFIREHSWAMAFFSWGNVVIEYLLPLAMMIWMENPIIQALFHLSSIIFHITIFALMGPNFIRYCLMHMLAWNPLGQFGFRPPSKTTTDATANLRPISWLCKLQAGITFYCLWAWFYVQFISDIEHFQGKVDFMERRNPYFPFPELSMFAKPKHPNYACAFFLVLISVIIYICVMFSTWALGPNAGEIKSFNFLIPYKRQEEKKQADVKGTMVVAIGEEEMALAQKQGQTFVVYDDSSSSWFQKRRSNESPAVVYKVEQDEE